MHLTYTLPITFFSAATPPAGAPLTRRVALACARCAFSMGAALLLRRGAHFPCRRVHGHQLWLAKLRSRFRGVRILKNELSPARGAHFQKPMFSARRRSPAPPPRTHQGALACAACSLLKKAVLSPRRRPHFAFERLLSGPRLLAWASAASWGCRRPGQDSSLSILAAVLLPGVCLQHLLRMYNTLQLGSSHSDNASEYLFSCLLFLRYRPVLNIPHHTTVIKICDA